MAQTLSDSELVARCRAGDQQAWAELVDRFSRYVYAISVQAFRLPDADAEDVFQEVFARAYEHLDKLRDDAAVRPWLAQLTRRLCIDRLRATTRERPTTDEELDLAGSEETLSMLEDAPQQRELLSRPHPRGGRGRQGAERLGDAVFVVAHRVTDPLDAERRGFLPSSLSRNFERQREMRLAIVPAGSSSASPIVL